MYSFPTSFIEPRLIRPFAQALWVRPTASQRPDHTTQGTPGTEQAEEQRDGKAKRVRNRKATRVTGSAGPATERLSGWPKFPRARSKRTRVWLGRWWGGVQAPSPGSARAQAVHPAIHAPKRIPRYIYTIVLLTTLGSYRVHTSLPTRPQRPAATRRFGALG